MSQIKPNTYIPHNNLGYVSNQIQCVYLLTRPRARSYQKDIDRQN
jgi:hypothetical protein